MSTLVAGRQTTAAETAALLMSKQSFAHDFGENNGKFI
jgi:hypothetical protein|tara:strand:- start:1074 stop:1187 length:114 start_codon:yes stop_codon:yes gene_type:complete